jgi:hypothetical protein
LGIFGVSERMNEDNSEIWRADKKLIHKQECDIQEYFLIVLLIQHVPVNEHTDIHSKKKIMQ